MLKEFKEFAVKGNALDMAVVSSSEAPSEPSSTLWSQISSCPPWGSS